MRYIIFTILSVCVFVVAAGAEEAEPKTYSIATDKVDNQKIYYGSADSFTKAGNVNYESIIKATPEYEEVKKKKVEVGTGKYWILLSQASDRAVRAIAEVGQENQYDLIAAHGYLNTLEPPIQSDDITKLVLEKLTNKKKK